MSIDSQSPQEQDATGGALARLVLVGKSLLSLAGGLLALWAFFDGKGWCALACAIIGFLGCCAMLLVAILGSATMVRKTAWGFIDKLF